MAGKEVMRFTCVQCPMGCPLEVALEDGVVTGVTGNGCARGRTYGEAEATCPVRVVTSLVEVEGDWHPISVKTAAPVPKALVPAVLERIRGAKVTPPVAEGDVVVANVAGTGVDVVATKGR